MADYWSNFRCRQTVPLLNALIWGNPLIWGTPKFRTAPFDPLQPKTPMIQANLVSLSFIEPELWAIVEVLHCGIRDFRHCSCDLDLDPMTFIYKLDPYYLEIHRMC